jgi:hypothetical protein
MIPNMWCHPRLNHGFCWVFNMNRDWDEQECFFSPFLGLAIPKIMMSRQTIYNISSQVTIKYPQKSSHEVCYMYIYTYPIKLLSKIRFNPIQVTIWNLPQKSSQLPHEAPEKSVGLEVSGWWRPAQGRGTSQWDPSPSRRSWPLTAGGKLRWSEKHGKTMGKCGKMWEDCGNYGKTLG